MMRILYIFFLIMLSLKCNTPEIRNNSELKVIHTNLCTEDVEKFKDEFQKLFLNLRSDNNETPPVRDSILERAANDFALKLRLKNSVEYDESERPLQRLKNEGISRDFVAENIAILKKDQITADGLFQKWKNGNIEKKNMINSKYHFFGFGVVSGSNSCYCVLILTN